MVQNVVLFQSANGDRGLWETNGTANGTFELAPITGANNSGLSIPSKHINISPGLSPSNLTVFNGEVLFEGFDSKNQYGLWVTNGTVTGTQELVAGAGGESRSAWTSNQTT